jgi:hypothetical protein
VKKLLIIQQDEAYFLFETIRVLEKNQKVFKDFELTILVDEKALNGAFRNSHPVISGLITKSQLVSDKKFDISVNLSLNEESWQLHGTINAKEKLGPYRKDEQTFVKDLWSSYFMTLKARAPFLTFHLQDFYKNILGIKSVHTPRVIRSSVRQIALGACATHLFSALEQENLLHELSMNFPNIPLRDISEIDLISDLTHTLYIGPASLDAVKFCEAGGKGIFLSSDFQGFNLLPYDANHLFLSSRGKSFQAATLLKVIENEISGKPNYNIEYSVYTIEHETQGPYLKSHNHSDDNYPIYQSHLVLWNFLLNLYDTNLEISRCTPNQIELLQKNQEVLKKYIRLHDYAMVSIDTIYHESKAKPTNVEKIEGHLKNLVEIEGITNQIAASHSMLRPVLDFYRIRRGQNEAETLCDQSQNSFLTYSEEHQALEALAELFSVTLKKNEVNI